MKKLLVIFAGLMMLFAVLPAGASDPEVIHACANGEHAVRLVDDPESCNGSETLVEWGVVGPEGPTGPSDGYDSGVGGIITVSSGSGWVTVQSQTLPAGSYILNAVSSIYSGNGSGCRLFDGTSEIDFRYFAPVSGTGNSNPMGSVTLGSETAVTLDCGKTISTYQVISPRITSIKVGTLH